MVTLEHITSLREYLDAGKTIAVVLGPNLQPDQYLAASALFIGIKSLDKDVGIYAPNILGEKFSFNDELQIELGKENLVVEFDYLPNSVDKVSYHIGEESQKFYLTIKPKKGSKPLNKKTVEISYAGADFDVIFLVGVKNLDDLEQLYYGYEEIYASSAVVTLNKYKLDFGNLHLDYSRQSGLSESMFEILQGMGVAITADMATDLLKGIELSSRDFTSLTATAETFETVAQLMRLGARRTKKQLEKSARQVRQSKQPAEQKETKKDTKMEVEIKPTQRKKRRARFN